MNDGSKVGKPLTGSSDSPSANASDNVFPVRLTTLLSTLREPAVRDLAWLLFSADLLQEDPPAGVLAQPFGTPAELAATLDWLLALDADPAALLGELAAHRITRLGRYAERLLGWFLQQGPSTRLIAAGVPLRRSGVTLGECDFLVQTTSGARLHWELAVKCYLHAAPDDPAQSNASSDASALRASRNSLACYVGPNLKDRFDLKLAHVLDHQLPLSARGEFASTGYPGPWTPQMFIKGWLFYQHGEAATIPAELDASHGRGWWVTQGDWPVFAATHAPGWRVLSKLEWLAPRRDARLRDIVTPPVIDSETLATQFNAQHGPFMVGAFEEHSEGVWLERSRGFIVPDDWPQRARAYAAQ